MDNCTLFKLSKKNYDLLKSVDLSKIGDSIQFDDTNLSFETDDVVTLQIALNYEIALNGMTNNQMECTEYGRALYALYDEILDQIE